MKLKIAWSSRDALFGMLLALPGAIVIATGSVDAGLALLLGALVPASVGLASRRRARIMIPIGGLAFFVAIFVGSFVAQWWFIAVFALPAIAYAAVQVAARKSVGRLLLTLVLPVTGIGLSFAGIENSIGLAVLVGVGSIVAFVAALLLPEYDTGARRVSRLLEQTQVQDYGLRLALAAAVATAIGYALNIVHIGWVVGSTLLVMRPAMHLEQTRAIGRMISVIAGTMAASTLLTLNLPVIPIALVAGLAIILMAGTHKSEWYVAPFFTTFLVFWVMLYDDPSAAAIHHRFWERILEVGAGIAIAVVFGILWPTLRARRAQHTS